ncbi:hypothetical protein KCP73_00210 [Salmonella enterica subsp. enterica]|nr:hypothetical protein KCP73_00210 [Salmonella enterica subsp. enterica]
MGIVLLLPRCYAPYCANDRTCAGQCRCAWMMCWCCALSVRLFSPRRKGCY